MTVKRPPGVSAAEGAGLPTAARTALVALRAAVGARRFDVDSDGRRDNKPPLNVLITAASGGVGHYAVQLAKAAGFHVTATCGAHAAELVRGLLGADDEVLDYTTPEGAALLSPSGRRYDGVVHCAVGTRWSTFAPLLADSGGTVVDITPTKSAMLRSVAHRVTFARKRLVPLFLWPNKEDLQFLVGLLRDGKLKTVVDSRFPLSQASGAWEKSLGGHPTGKIVVEMGHDSV
jgi:NADPH:quinone reductase-like Zn-dependent oxidoreductase